MRIPKDTGCSEYQQMNRRGAISTLGAMASAWLPQIGYTEEEPQPNIKPVGGGEILPRATTTRDIVVTLFLRGGADGLVLCPPWKDNDYANYRRGTRIFPPTSSDAYRKAIDLNGYFGLPQAMAPLKSLYTSKNLLITHQTGSLNDTRSHFDAQHFMEVGVDSKQVWVGWMARHLNSVTPTKPDAVLRGVALAGLMPQILDGATQTAALTDLTNYALPGDNNTIANRLRWLTKAYSTAETSLSNAAANAVKTLNLLQTINYPAYQPATGVVYNPPAVSTLANGDKVNTDMAWHVRDFGESLKSTAALIKSGVGIETVHVDFGGWDFHRDEWVFEGRNNDGSVSFGWRYWFPYSLAANLAAFYKDLDATKFSDGTTLMNRVTVVVMSEFGRTVNENGNYGTDHGHGGTMMFLGKNVNGGRVDADWKSLGTTGIDTFGGLATTLDYRIFLGELLEKRLLNGGQLGTVFPGYVKPVSGWRGAFKTL
ncbi:MAG: DUF1501 domain-containing protein [Armatimonadetes bacterium]|nr:DUF1501 domain-containing protein [Armatimonadota bacterium]